jgi:hypothetical protein
MSQSKAISPEINGLFERIENQANEYEKAFNDLNKFQRDSDRIKRSNEELINRNTELLNKNTEILNRLDSIENYIALRLNNMYAEVLKHIEVTALESFKKSSEKVIDEFRNKAEDTIGLIQGSTGILELLEKMRNFSVIVDKQLLVIDEKISALNNKDVELITARNDFDKLKQKTEENLKDIKIQLDNAIKDNQNKLEISFNEAVYHLEERIKETIIALKNTHSTINQKLRLADDKISGFVEIAVQLEEHLKGLQQSSKNNNINKNAINEIKLRIEEVNSSLHHEIEELSTTINSFDTFTDNKKKYRLIKITDEELKNNN